MADSGLNMKDVKESLSKKQLAPVVQSFRAHAQTTRPDDDLQRAMGEESWDLQVGKATQDFENHLKRVCNRILGRLERGGYAPPSAMNHRDRPMDVDTKKKQMSKVGSKASREISKSLGLT